MKEIPKALAGSLARLMTDIETTAAGLDRIIQASDWVRAYDLNTLLQMHLWDLDQLLTRDGSLLSDAQLRGLVGRLQAVLRRHRAATAMLRAARDAAAAGLDASEGARRAALDYRMAVEA